MSMHAIPALARGLATGTWRIDPTRSSVEFHVPNLWGLATVSGTFDRFEGELHVSRPAAVLVIESGSLDTGNQRRDKHLRSEDFFDVVNHPRVRFEAYAVERDGATLQIRGLLYAAGKQLPLDVDAAVTAVGDEWEIEATALVDQRELGMTWSPLGMVRTPSRLVLRGRLVPIGDASVEQAA